MPSLGLGCQAIRCHGCGASLQLFTAHTCPCWEQEQEADSKPLTHPFLYQLGMLREGDALSEVT